MTEPATTPPAPMSKARLEAFSDGVFAIVVTLLVFGFKLPDLPPHLAGEALERALESALLGMAPRVVSYVLSFALISLFWIAHHRFFALLTRADEGLLWHNTLFLLLLAFLPFPAQLLGTYPHTETAVLFFGLSMVLTSASFSLMRHHAFFRARLVAPEVPQALLVASLRRSLLTAGLYLLALLISFYSTTVTMSLYALIPFLFFVPAGRPR